MLQIGDTFEQVRGQFVGRRGRIVYTEADPPRITLDPMPGNCPCSLKQRRTTIRLRTLLDEWKQIGAAN